MLKHRAGRADIDAMRTRFLMALRRLRSDESGQSLVIMGVAMTMIMGVAALGIDTASWEAHRHQDQVVADASALAAANCLANPTVGPGSSSMPLCTSDAAAQQVAVSYAAANGLTITTGQVTVAGGTVTVNANSTSPSYFAKVFGFGAAAESASATASYAAGASAVCTTALQDAGQCYAIYTQDASCGSSDGWSASSASINITGAIHTQGTFNFGGSGGTYTFHGPVTYSSGNCTFTKNQQTTWGNTNDTPVAGANQASAYWPLDYSTVFPACSTSAGTCTTSAATNGVLGSPSYCTKAVTGSTGFAFTSYPATFASNVYCSIGSGTPSDPATWNGPFTFTNGVSGGSSNTPLPVTMIGGSVTGNSSTLYLTPYMGNCLIYALDADSGTNYAVNFGASGGGNFNLSGGIFAPNGTIHLTSTSATAAFLEAQNVITANLTFQGDGPAVTSTGATASGAGSDTLTQ
jgi:hypothetical protein